MKLLLCCNDVRNAEPVPLSKTDNILKALAQWYCNAELVMKTEETCLNCTIVSAMH